MKQLPSLAVDQLNGRKLIMAGAIRASFPSGPYRLWSGGHQLPGDLVGDVGEFYQPIKDRALIVPYASQIGGAADSLIISVSGLDPDVAQTIENEDYHQKPVVVYRIVFAPDGNTPLGFMTMMRGKCDYVVQRETIGGKASLDFNIEGARRDMNRAGGRIRSDADQRVLGGALDGCFRHITYAGHKTLWWGNKPSSVSNTVGGVGGFVQDFIKKVVD